MTESRKKLEPARAAAVALIASLSLAACSATPRTELSWGVNDRIQYGPRHVSLPPVQHRRVAVETPRWQPITIVPKARPSQWNAPGWYQASAPAPAQTAKIETVSSAPVDASARFVWPVAGRIISAFGTNGGQRNDGINIAAVAGAPIHASASGTVSYCGNELKGYGNLVLIKHDNGYITAYAHAGSILVERGARVSAGQVIATAGATGDVTTPQLHFEIRQGIRPLDPQSLLPRTLVMAEN